MPISSHHLAVRRYRRALAIERASGRDADEVFDELTQAARTATDRSLERSAALDPARERVLDAMDRRSFLRDGLLVGAGALALGARASRAPAGGAPRIVVVGAGFAGLTAAWKIHAERGWPVQVYEARSRVGGRVHTIRSLAAGQYTEAGGSGINSNQAEITALCQRLNLWPLVDTWLRYPGGGQRYVFDGAARSWSSIKPAVTAVANASWDAWVAIGRQIPSRAHHNAAAVTYDAMTVTEFMTNQAGVAPTSIGGQYLASLFGGEYGGRATDASALHQILEEGNFWGSGYDERWAVPGGNDRLAHALAARLPTGSVHLGQALQAIRRRADGSYRLTFAALGGATGGTHDVIADRVVLALPPTTLRDVDTTRGGLTAAAHLAIDNEGMGSGVKFNLQFDSRPWKADGANGDAVTDLVPAEVWQASYQAAAPALLLFLNNRSYPSLAAHGTVPTALLQQTLADLDAIWPGCSAAAIRAHAYVDNWPRDPWVQGTYSYYPPGGFTSFGGVGSTRAGRISFAGEHTAAYPDRGTMGGAVASGLRAAREVLGLA